MVVKLEIDVPDSHYVTSGMFQKECQLYRGPMCPKIDYPRWMTGVKRNGRRKSNKD
jgi:hypothetical protein